MTYSYEEFNYTVNLLGHCWEGNQPGNVRIKCPDLGQSRTSYREGQDEDICCYNCNKYGHCSRDCRLPNRTRKDQEPVLTEGEIRKICKKVITENVKPRENHLLHNACSLQHRVNNLSICRLQGEVTKYLWTCIDRHWKFSTFCYSLGGVLGVHRGQD